MRTEADHRRDAHGFTLIEVVVALAIAGLAIAVVFQTISIGLTGTRTALKTEEAVSRAKSRLAATAGELDRLVGAHAGDDGDGFDWRLAVIELDEAGRGGPNGLRHFEATVTEHWREGDRDHSVTLTTRRLLAPSAPAAPAKQ